MIDSSYEFDQYHPRMKEVIENVQNVIVGKKDVIELLLIAILAQGHVLLEDVPGVGKTMLVRALARTSGCTFKRIQFTPDLLPSDVTGVSIFNQKTMNFEFKSGPVFGQFILADEINRTSPKTQSALLEAMEEGHVTVDGDTHQLPKPFIVMATQNPIEYEGTYPLPEAQLDRFLLKLNLGYPTAQDEVDMLERSQLKHPITSLEAMTNVEELQSYQQAVRQVHVSRAVKDYIVKLTQGSREHKHIYLGASPRGSVALMRSAQARALIRGRAFVIPDDVKYLAPYALLHRIILRSEARLSGERAEKVLDEIIQATAVPVQSAASMQSAALVQSD